MWKKRAKDAKTVYTSGVQVTLAELIALRSKIKPKTLSFKKASRGILTGQNVAKLRGKGIEFDTTREYQPGDDIRRMAWRVTARSLQPHIKVYLEEKERPIWLGVDLSPSLFFGTRGMFKSVKIIKQASKLGWSYLQKRERIGALIAKPQRTLIYRPQTREREFLTILNSLAECSTSPPDFNENNCLHQLLMNLLQQIRSGNLIFILSDFFQFDSINQKLILHFAQRAQVVLIFVYDPFEATPPPAYPYVLTDGEKTALFNMQTAQNRNVYQKQFQEKLTELIQFSQKYNIALEVLRTDQEEDS